jgi:PrkA serine protein kinase C-terminal domain
MLGNENFRRAVKDLDTEEFKAYDKKIRAGIEFLINNLCTKFGYTQFGAREVCIYVIDNQLGIKNDPEKGASGRPGNDAPIELPI